MKAMNTRRAIVVMIRIMSVPCRGSISAYFLCNGLFISTTAASYYPLYHVITWSLFLPLLCCQFFCCLRANVSTKYSLLIAAYCRLLSSWSRIVFVVVAVHVSLPCTWHLTTLSETGIAYAALDLALFYHCCWWWHEGGCRVSHHNPGTFFNICTQVVSEQRIFTATVRTCERSQSLSLASGQDANHTG